MKLFSYKTVRRTTFTVYIILTVIFCSLIMHYGKKEIQRARHYAVNERKYFNALLGCRNMLSQVDDGFIAYLQAPSLEKAGKFSQHCYDFRQQTDVLANISRHRQRVLQQTGHEIHQLSQQLYAIALALFDDHNAHFTERSLLLQEGKQAADQALKKTRQKLQSLLRSEFDHVEIWQNQSAFFYNRLQYLVVSFFILTTIFTVAASFLFSYVLNIFLKKLQVGTHEISSGNLKYRFELLQRDELGLLMADFNKMAAKLEKQTDTIFKANNELQQKTDELLEANQHKDRFMANMSHELRTPLNSVIGFADLMLNRAEKFKPDRIKGYSKRILLAAEHLLNLISDLLSVAKVDAGVLQPVFTTFNLSETIQDTCEILAPMVEKKQLKLLVDLPGTLPFEGDKKFMIQILINLINNAIKFTHKGRITVAVFQEEEYYIIKISDTGIGISDEDQRMIFKDFHRAEAGLTSNYDGVGLGLTLSKRLVELHKGCIIVSSIINKGTTFSIKLPKKQ